MNPPLKSTTIVRANRASAILYSLLRSRTDPRPFLLPANVCPVVPAVFLKAGKAFEFVDISEEDFCIDQARVLDQVRSHRYGGVLLVRTYGYQASFDGFFAELRDLDNDLLLIDDRCLCEPSFDGPTDGAQVVLYSTGPRKFTDIGYGGYAFVEGSVPYRPCSAAYSPSALQYITSQYKRCIADRGRYVYVDADWLDCGMPAGSLAEYRDAVAAETALALVTKARNNACYRSALPEDIVLGEAWNGWRFCVLVGNKAALLERIFSCGLFASSHYASLAGVFGPGDAPVARSLHDSVINLFNDRYVSGSQAKQLAELVARYARAGRRLR